MEALATDVPRLTATVVATDLLGHLMKRSFEWHMHMSKILSAMTRPNIRSKLCKYRTVLRNLRLRDRVKPFEIHFFAAGCCHNDATAQCFLLLALAMAFVLIYEK